MATEDGSQKTAHRRNNREAHKKRDREKKTKREGERGGEAEQAQLSSTRGESESEICQTHNDFGFFTRIFFFWTLRNDL